MQSKLIMCIMSARLSNKSPVVAKVSTNAFQLEREFYVIKKLYQKDEAPSYLGTIIGCYMLESFKYSHLV